MNIAQIISATEIGIFYALIAIAVFITLRIINFADMTVDGSFTLGAAVSALMITSGTGATIAIFGALVAGGIAGSITGILNARLKIQGLLASILVMTALYSVNMRIMGKPNISISGYDIFTGSNAMIICSAIVLVVIALIHRLFASQVGLAIRAVGINPKVCAAYGIEIGKMQIFTLALSNSIVSMCGALFAINQGFSDISMGTGTIVSGLAAVIIGETILGHKSILISLIACTLGSILYRIGISLALSASSLGMQASDINIVTAIFVIIMMVVRTSTKRKV